MLAGPVCNWESLARPSKRSAHLVMMTSAVSIHRTVENSDIRQQLLAIGIFSSMAGPESTGG